MSIPKCSTINFSGDGKYFTCLDNQGDEITFHTSGQTEQIIKDPTQKDIPDNATMPDWAIYALVPAVIGLIYSTRHDKNKILPAPVL